MSLLRMGCLAFTISFFPIPRTLSDVICEQTSATPDGLVARYLFNGDAADTSGNGHDGIISGGTLTFDRFGEPNRAISFSGNDRVIIQSPNLFCDAAGTISLWVLIPEEMSGGSGQGRIIPFQSSEDLDSSGNGRFLTLGIGDVTQVISGEMFGVVGGTGTDNNRRSAVSASTTGPLSAGWHHFVVTSDANGHLFYIDGIQYSPNLSASGLPPTQNLWPFAASSASIGGIPPLAPALDPYTVDDVLIFNRALEPGEVQSVFLSLPPETIITSAFDGFSNPILSGDLTLSHSIAVAFIGSDSVGIDHFEFRLDEGNFQSAVSPLFLSGLETGVHAVMIRAVNLAGAADPSPSVLTWIVATPEEVLGDLLTTIQGLLGSGDLSNGQATSFSALLTAALNNLEGENLQAACHQIGAYIKQVEAQEKNGRISPGVAQALISPASAILQNFGCL